MEFSPQIIALLFSSAIIAAFIQRVSGFGFGIFIMTLLPLFMPSYGESTTLSGLLALSQSLVVAIQMRKYIVWKRIIPMLTAFLLVSYITIGYVASFEYSFLMHILGITLIVLSIYFFFFSSKIHIKQSIPMQFGIGSISGVMGGFFGMQGPPAVLYYVQSEPDKNSYSAQTQVYFVTGNIFMSFVRAQNGFFTIDVGKAWIFAIAGVVVGTIIGSMVFKRISADKLKKVVYGYMAISGVIMLFK
ncbi:MAG: sulfite exporter TauE/SafE family protein [Paludibacteraceae bacterium]|nr:sulfite exporter TauE/SafE family protein [Paludibacteraceae bacterium]